jgi:hypothetical protein
MTREELREDMKDSFRWMVEFGATEDEAADAFLAIAGKAAVKMVEGETVYETYKRWSFWNPDGESASWSDTVKFTRKCANALSELFGMKE